MKVYAGDAVYVQSSGQVESMGKAMKNNRYNKS
jgi:hypothetical protein